jgi:Fe-S cluster biogenesis protein NfuA
MATKDEIKIKVNTAIEVIRPYLQNDGGDISLVEITDDLTVRVKLHGACGSCPYSLMTLKNGVEQAIRRDVPEIKEVVAVDMA